MTWHLTKKEIMNHLLDYRFLVSSIIGLCLIVLTTVILSGQYSKQVDQYNEFINSDREALNEVKCFSELRLNAHRPPNPLWIFNKGVINRVDSTLPIRHNWVPRQGLETRSENPFMNIFTFFDLTTIFQILFSLVAVLMVYDAISGEREAGTLKVTLSSSVARYQIIISKMLAGFLSLAIPLLVSLLLSLLIMAFAYDITFTAAQWLRIGLIVLTTLLFLGGFIMTGLLISCLTRHPSVSLIWLLFIWVAGVIIQPNMGSYIASAIRSVPPRDTVESAEGEIWQELYQKYPEINQKIIEEVPGEAWHSDHSDNWPFYNCFDGTMPALYRYVLRTQRCQPLFVDYADKAWQAYQGNYFQYLDKQYAVQELFNKFSPAALCRRTTSALAQTSIKDNDNFINQARQYRQTYLSYLIDERKVFSENANLYFTQQTMEQILNSDYMERRERARETGEKMVHYGRDYFGPLNLAGLPRFTYRFDPIGHSIRSVLTDFIILLLLPVILFYLCTIAFNRYDVRSD
jgi:ABC-type transport system involved in multi-copper enzyme maturation permease subunit